ncbi:hypothetical protein [Methylobacterium ajmalii]|uniref:hypothetical protein n=1 Tax=Methylobacterium ajmalii TaxID=2738439 RepID=UPI00190C33B6|nr:hypothetical protein [Methylobacterium ajmalii]MBK3398051.1 hypothetical protein [Methylobacterium ajmalii]MBK3406917.1 hypothetical protein [Methylobacterium ajmalii]
MLDDLVVGIRQAWERGPTPDLRDAVDRVDHILEFGQRFVLTPGVVRLANDLADGCRDPHGQLAHVRVPGIATWIEWHGAVPWSTREARRAVYVVSLDPTRPITGDAMWMHPTPGGAYVSRNWVFSEGTWKGEPPLPPHRAAHFEEPTGTPLQLAWLISVLALITTPRIVERDPVDLSRVNRARAKRGKRELVGYSEIVLRRDGPEEDMGRAYGKSPARDGDDVVRRARHHVRTHWRLKRGRIEIVRPHWRGDESLGTIRQIHRVARPSERVSRSIQETST